MHYVQVSLEASTCTNHLLDPAFGGVYASEEQAPRTRIPPPEELHCHPMHPGCNPCIQAATHASRLQPHAQAVTPCILWL